ncbi:MAG: HPP family protein [Thermoplasmata archaeon]|nr:MAG: HPP family protein [Thermoplasmata archaeon]
MVLKRSGVMGRKKHRESDIERRITRIMSKSSDYYRFYILDKKLVFRRVSWVNYLFQSLLALITMFIVLLFINIATGGIIVAVIGSTAFVVFAMPHERTAKARNVIGGHIVGIVSGIASYALAVYIMENISPQHVQIFSASLSVGLSTLIMVITDTEHPPAGGTAIWFSIRGADLGSAMFIIAASALLMLSKYILGERMKNLV